MGSVIVIFSSLFAILIIAFIGMFFWIRSIQNIDFESLKTSKAKDSKGDFNLLIKASIIVAILLVVFSFLSPFLFTRFAATEQLNFKSTGAIGDTIGGLMNPFITIAGVIVTGLAFYMQYRANKIQKENFEIELNENKVQFQKQMDTNKFESKFYEMLSLHRANVEEMEIEGYQFEDEIIDKDSDKINSTIETKKVITKKKAIAKTTRGRKVFVTMQKEFETIIQILLKDGQILNKNTFTKCYDLFFFGIDWFEEKHFVDKSLLLKFEDARNRHKNGTITNRKIYSSDVFLYFNYLPYSGHSSRLGHYFRHLFLIVKSVANNETLKHEEKMDYLKILRAQLSNHEQIMLFYNWVSDFGGEWENENNRFFTDYCMIHNLWHQRLFKDPYIESQIQFLKDRPKNLRTGPLFEMV